MAKSSPRKAVAASVVMVWFLQCPEPRSYQSEASKKSGRVIFNRDKVRFSLLGVQTWSTDSNFGRLPAHELKN